MKRQRNKIEKGTNGMRKVKSQFYCILFDYKIKEVKKKTIAKISRPYIIGSKSKEKERVQ